MTEFDSGDGGFTGNADGAPYTGYDPGPDQPTGSGPADASGVSEDELRRLQEIDKPIEHDPWGQALVSLPAAAITGLGEAAVEGAELGGALLKEGVSWVAAEVGIAGGEHVVEGDSEHGSSEPSESAPDQPDAGYDPTQDGAGYE
jgi:hypothetical protein